MCVASEKLGGQAKCRPSLRAPSILWTPSKPTSTQSLNARSHDVEQRRAETSIHCYCVSSRRRDRRPLRSQRAATSRHARPRRIRRLDAGSWKGARFKGERVETLNAVLLEATIAAKAEFIQLLGRRRVAFDLVPRLKQNGIRVNYCCTNDAETL